MIGCGNNSLALECGNDHYENSIRFKNHRLHKYTQGRGQKITYNGGRDSKLRQCEGLPLPAWFQLGDAACAIYGGNLHCA